MRIFYTLITAFAVCFSVDAQVVIGAESAPLIGDSWATYNVVIPSARVPLPMVGARMEYDFTDVGDFPVDDFQLLLKDIPLDEFIRLDVLAVPEGTGEPAFDDLPATALLTSVVLPELDDDGNEVAFNSIIDVNDTAVFTLVESDLNFSTGSIDLVRLSEPNLVFRFGQELGTSTSTTTITVEDNEAFMTEDSTTVIETKEYAGYGSLKTWFGEYDEVAVYKTLTEVRYYNRDLGSTDPFTVASVQIIVSYDFHRPGSFAPVVSYTYDTFDRDAQPVPEDINFSFSQPLNLTDVTSTDREALRLSASPNPATRLVNVAFEQPAAGAALLTLYDPAGREVLRRNPGTLPAGNQQIPLELPEGLAGGTYFLRLSSGAKTSAIPLVIR